MDVPVITDCPAPEDDAEADLGRTVLTRLAHAATRVSAEQGRQLRAIGLSPSAFAVLCELRDADDEGLQPCALADLLGVTRPSICGLIDGLEAKRLVARTPHRRDRRRVLVLLTDRGEELLDEHTERYREAERQLLADLSTDDQQVLADLLDRVASRAPAPVG